MAAALKRVGKRVQLTVLRGDDHYLDEPETRISLLQDLETFLATHLTPLPATTGHRNANYLCGGCPPVWA